MLGAVIGADAAAIAERLHVKHHDADGMFGAFFRRIRSGGFTVQSAMLLLSHSVSRLGYLLRCLPPAAIERLAVEWDTLLMSAAVRVLDIDQSEVDAAVYESLQRPLRLGGFGLTSAALISPFAFIASVAASATQPDDHALSDNAPPASLLYQWLHAALTHPSVQCDQLPSADTFNSHYHATPALAAGLQSKLTSAATHSLYNARVNEMKEADDKRGLARLYGGAAKYASRWKTVAPTEPAYILPDEYYRYAARRDIGLKPTKDRILPRQCGSCGMSVAADGLHGQRCIHNSHYTKLRHDSIERLLHAAVRDGIGLSYRQQHNLPSAARTIPDLLFHLGNQPFLCDVTVVDTLADSNLATAVTGPGKLADEAAERKRAKYSATEAAMGARHLPFAVESMGGLSETARSMIREIHNAAEQHCTWREARTIGAHLVDAVAISVQCCIGMALRASRQREMKAALGAEAA